MRTRGRTRDPRRAAGLDAETVVRTPFASGRVDWVLPTSKPDGRADALHMLDADDDARMEWDRDRGPSPFSRLTGECAGGERGPRRCRGIRDVGASTALRHSRLRRGRSGLCG
ncbi:hypothetical protein [Streptomyces sp. NPDC002133]|uniref:hypothetical protein n=1 Tax=Streptomyces sp. NPDC002133 TaxID=3154409 RepID=UPI00332DF4A2